jgi:hypothetical protein
LLFVVARYLKRSRLPKVKTLGTLIPLWQGFVQRMLPSCPVDLFSNLLPLNSILVSQAIGHRHSLTLLFCR